ncbi:MAG TPA: hypothetical protein VFM79_12965 [Pelobium sp.]|nr:hypothetical protein [Pelobium sp.]
MTLLQTIKTALISVLNKVSGFNKSTYSPEYVRIQNQPNNKLTQALRQADASQKSL